MSLNLQQQDHSNLIEFPQKNSVSRREYIDNKDIKDNIDTKDTIYPFAFSERQRQNAFGSSHEIKNTPSWDDKWATKFSHLDEKDFFYVGVSLFDNGKKPNSTRFKLSCEYITEKGSQDWKKIIFTVASRQRDVKNNLPIENGVSLWTHDFYQTLKTFADQLTLESQNTPWLVKPIVCKAHKQTPQTKGTHGMGAVLPFVAGVFYWIEGQNPQFHLALGTFSQHFDLGIVNEKNKVAKGDWKRQNVEQTFAELEL